MSSESRTTFRFLVIGVMLSQFSWSLATWGQEPTPGETPQRRSASANESQTSAFPTAPNSEAEKRAAILESDEWKRARYAFDEWLSIQKIYTPAEVARLKLEFQGKINAMTADELQEFLRQMEGRLNILLSNEARDARAWVGQTMSVLASHPREEFRQRLPDVLDMTPAQMQQYLSSFQARQRQAQQASATASRLRGVENQILEQRLQSQQQALQQARQRQQNALANQATNRAQGSFQQSMQNFRQNTWAPDRLYWEPVVPPGAWNYGGYWW